MINDIMKAEWIKSRLDYGEVCSIFRKTFSCGKNVIKAKLQITAMGVYEACLNGMRIGNFFLAPGWTEYDKRHQYQTYDVTEYIKDKNTFDVTVGKGWYRGMLIEWRDQNIWGGVSAIIAALNIEYDDGTIQTVFTDTTWHTSESPIRMSEIYDGETYDALFVPSDWEAASILHASKSSLIPQEGEVVCEHGHIPVKAVIRTPNGETVFDFGQNMAGYVSFSVNAKKGDIIEYSHGETLDKDGNLYTKNLRSAKQHIRYICRDGKQSYRPHFTFMGFRYIRIERIPEGMSASDFTAVPIYSDMRRTGYFDCSNNKVNRLYENVIWGQKSNFIDVPTDCPQRDERLGWTGDAQVFIKTAAYNFDVKKFFQKWLHDLAAAQKDDGAVPQVIPSVLPTNTFLPCAGWGDAAVICPWQIYVAYGDKSILEEQLNSMEAWINYILSHTTEEYLWCGANQLGDWLALDAVGGISEENMCGASNEDLVASAYFAYSVSIVIKARNVLGLSTVYYQNLYNNILTAFRKKFKDYRTQTECVLALAFDLTKNRKETAEKLVRLIKENNNKLSTGFVGTTYLLTALSYNGYTELAYSLLLEEDYPSWLFSVNMGATTIWEHWDGMKKDGSMWSDKMNSFNHYAYGSVAAWMYETILGIKVDESRPGFENVILHPQPDRRLKWAEGSFETKYGTIKSKWHYEDECVRYEFTVPNKAVIIIGKNSYKVNKGIYVFCE